MKYFKWHGIPVSLPETKKEWIFWVIIPLTILDLTVIFVVILLLWR